MRVRVELFGSTSATTKTSPPRGRPPPSATTIRSRRVPQVFLFEDDEAHRMLNGTVTGVERHRLDRLTAEQARLDGFTSIDELKKGLQGHYPGPPSDAEVELAAFTVEAPDAVE